MAQQFVMAHLQSLWKSTHSNRWSVDPHRPYRPRQSCPIMVCCGIFSGWVSFFFRANHVWGERLATCYLPYLRIFICPGCLEHLRVKAWSEHGWDMDIGCMGQNRCRKTSGFTCVATGRPPPALKGSLWTHVVIFNLPKKSGRNSPKHDSQRLSAKQILSQTPAIWERSNVQALMWTSRVSWSPWSSAEPCGTGSTNSAVTSWCASKLGPNLVPLPSDPMSQLVNTHSVCLYISTTLSLSKFPTIMIAKFQYLLRKLSHNVAWILQASVQNSLIIYPSDWLNQSHHWKGQHFKLWNHQHDCISWYWLPSTSYSLTLKVAPVAIFCNISTLMTGSSC